MENLSRNLAQNAQVKTPGHPHKTRRRWTVLLIGDLGKIVSFRVTKSLLLALPAFLAAMLAVASYSVISYESLRLENSQLRNNLDALRAELETAEKAREKALVGLMVLEDNIKQTARKASPASDRKTKRVTAKATKPRQAAKQTARPKPSETPKPAATVSAKVKPPETPKPAAKQTARVEASETAKPAAVASLPTEAEEHKIASPASPARILVKDLEVWREPDGSAFKFKFALKNIDQESGRVSGYTFVVFKPREISGEPIRAFPWSPLKDRMPAIFKRGQYFAIAHFKFVRGTLTDVSTIDRFETATVYVYSDTGDLLAEEVFEVGKILRS
ncbi:MAG: hypothetical protein KAU38_10295 [Desulfobacterales bacterium]|nr:hypothetical protein [Desulfobacterales bacterium]